MCVCVCVCVCVTTGDGAFGSSRGYPDPCLSPAGSVYQSTEAGVTQAGKQGGTGLLVGGWKSLLKVSVKDGAAHPPPGATRPLWGSRGDR